MFNAKIAYTAPTINTSGVITSMTTGATSGGNVSASGGSGSYSYSVYSGSLPYNLTLNTSTGYITGTLQAGGTFNVVFNVTDTVSGLSTQSGTVTITTTYSNVYAYAYQNPSNGTYSDLAKISLDLSSVTHNNFFTQTGSWIVSQMDTDSYGRIFAPFYSYSGISIWSNNSYSSIYVGSGINLISGACLGPDGNMYVGGQYNNGGGYVGCLIKFDSSLTQTTYLDYGVSTTVLAICSDGSSKIYSLTDYGIRSFDTSSHAWSSITSSLPSGQSWPQITYAADGKIYLPATAVTGTRVARHQYLQLNQWTTSGTYTAYIIHNGGGGMNDYTGGICSTVVSGTPYVYLGANSDLNDGPFIASFNTSTNAATSYNPGSGTGANFKSVIAHTNGSIYGACYNGGTGFYTLAKLTTGGTLTYYNGTSVQYSVITSGPQ